MCPKSPPSLPTESSRLHSSPKSVDQRRLSTERMVLGDGTADQAIARDASGRDEGENSRAFALALDPVISPAEDATLFYSGTMLRHL